MHEKRFEGDISRLRNPDRIARLEVDRVIAICMEDTQIKSVLDIGTGTGVFAEGFTRYKISVCGVDVNPEMLPAARTYAPTANFCRTEAEMLPFLNASFDLIFMGLLLHESDEQIKVLKEARRVAHMQVGILEWAYRQEDIGAPLIHRLAPETLEKLAEEAGFKKLEVFPLTTLVLYQLKL
jgi:ubiquinone/menaquinone biosynthesis C-methylase UbiE